MKNVALKNVALSHLAFDALRALMLERELLSLRHKVAQVRFMPLEIADFHR